MCAGLPFYWSALDISFTDACFEAVSALTTTGSTVFSNLDHTPKGILLWRAILQWLGGIGIVVMAMTIFPALRIGGMQLFRSEFSDRSEKILPRVSQIASALLTIYVSFTVMCCVFLSLCGMSTFDSICHAMSAISTGGFSTRDGSIASFDSPSIELILSIFMFIGGSTLILYVRVWNGDMRALNDSQLKTYAGYTAFFVILLSMWFYFTHNMPLLSVIRQVSFSVISVITSTGFTVCNYSHWGPFASLILFMLFFSGGCTGSTAGGIKIFRFQVLYQFVKNHLLHLRRPYGVYIPMYQGQKINDTVSISVFSFFALYIFTVIVLALGLSLMNFDFVSSFTGAASALGNTGQGLGQIIGPLTNFATLATGPKCVLMIGMILGRLELLTVIVLLTPSFWKD
jgi:trk system potassium uptake protein TrkH